MWGGSHNETKENPEYSNRMGVPMMAGVRKSSKVTPFAPQVKPMAKPGTFIDAQFDGVSPASKSNPTSSSKTGSPVKTKRIKMFSVEGDSPYAMDMESSFGHGTQSAIDSLAEDIEEEMLNIDKKLLGIVRPEEGGTRLRGIHDRRKAKFVVEKTRKKLAKSLKKMHLVRKGAADGGASFLHSSSEEDEEVLMTGLADHDMALNGALATLQAPLDPNIKKQLILALKMKRTYKSALTNVSTKYRKALKDLDKVHGELANVQGELEIAHTQASRGGGSNGIGVNFAVGTNNESKRDEEDRARRDRERKKLLAAAGGGEGDEIEGDIDSNQPQALKFCNKIGKLYSKYKPLRGDVTKIEQRFGTSVASYFKFYQWMFLNSIIVWLLYLTGFFYHLYLNTGACTLPDGTFDEKSLDTQFIDCRPYGLCLVETERSNKWGTRPCHSDTHCLEHTIENNQSKATTVQDSNGETTTGKCEKFYENIVYGRVSYTFQTATAGSWVPELFMFSSFTADEAWVYTLMLLLSILVMMVQTVIKWSAEDRKLKMISAFEGSGASQNKYAKLILNSWDHNLHSVRDVRDHKLFIAESLRMLVQDAEAAESSSSRTLQERVILYLRRAFFILLYIAFQIGGMTLIVITLAGQSVYIKIAGDYLFKATEGAIEITPIVVGIVNGIIPQITTRLLKQEKYDDQGTVIKQTVLRIFLTKTFNILIQVVSYLLLQDPFLFAAMDSPPQFFGSWHENAPAFQMINLRSIFKKAFSTALDNPKSPTKADFSQSCRVNQVGLNLFAFLYIAFATEVLMAFLFPAIAFLKSRIKRKPLKKAQFDVALKMIGLLYFTQICLFTMPFMPLVGTIFIFLLYFKFKMEIFITNKFGRKPKKAWAAKDSGEFFLQFYLVSIFIWICINYLFLVTTTQPKSCSSQFKFLPETLEIDGTKYPRMNLISQECDLLWHDLEGSSLNKSSSDYKFDEYVDLPPSCIFNGGNFVDKGNKVCVPCPVDKKTATATDIAKCAGKTTTMQDLANLKHSVTTKTEPYGWVTDFPETYTNGELYFTEVDQDKYGQEIANLEGQFYKAKKDDSTKIEIANLTGTIYKASNERLTVRHSFRLWLDKVSGVELSGLSQVEEVQRTDLLDKSKCLRDSCTIDQNGTLDRKNCALCGYYFIEKYKLLRQQKLYFPNGTIENVAANKALNNNQVSLTYSDVGITNNERMVMCACYKGVGPFAESENGFQSVRELAAYYSIFAIVYGIMVNSSLFSWFVATTFCIALLFSKNSAVVSTDYAADQRFYFTDQINVLNKRNQQISKKYNRLRMNIES